MSSYFWPRLTDSGDLPRPSDTWRGFSLVDSDSYWPPWHVASETWEGSSEHSENFQCIARKVRNSIRSLISPSPHWAAWMNVTLPGCHWVSRYNHWQLSHQHQWAQSVVFRLMWSRLPVNQNCVDNSQSELHSDHSAPWAGSISAHRVWSGGELDCLLPVFARHLALRGGVYRSRWARPSSSWAALFYQI